MYLELWAEGAATYVSQRMNPGTSDGVALLDPSLGELSAAEVANLARAFLSQVNDDDDASAVWFSGGARRDPRVPVRAGYLLGLRAAQSIGKELAPAEIARLAGAPLLAQIQTTLRALSAR
jgi:hypothetical protein